MPKTIPKRIVVVTDRLDAHLPFVQRHLSEPLTIIDPLTILEGNHFTYQVVKGKLVLTYGDQVLDNVTAAWYRKPRFVEASQLPVSEDLKPFAKSAIYNHIAVLRDAFEDALWISDYQALDRGENKGLQLKTAASLGFRVPETLITSDAKRAERFIKSQDTYIVKPQGSVAPIIDGEYYNFYATRKRGDDTLDLSGLHIAPAFFQQAIDPAYDIRVTVVGDKVFAANIYTDNPSTSATRDWRADSSEGRVRIEAFDKFPKKLAQLCVEHVKALGLKFGAIDLVADKMGEFWFLENNPNGQWGFIEQATGQPIGKAIAQLLERGNA